MAKRVWMHVDQDGPVTRADGSPDWYGELRDREGCSQFSCSGPSEEAVKGRLSEVASRNGFDVAGYTADLP